MQRCCQTILLSHGAAAHNSGNYSALPFLADTADTLAHACRLADVDTAMKSPQPKKKAPRRSASSSGLQQLETETAHKRHKDGIKTFTRRGALPRPDIVISNTEKSSITEFD